MNSHWPGLDVDGHVIGHGNPVFVIAEAGVNHNADMNLAMQLVEVARSAGADAVKFQTWITEEAIAPSTPLADYQRTRLGSDRSQYAMAKELELSFDDFRAIKAYCDAQGVLFLSTPDEQKSADFLDELAVSAFKIGSADVTALPFLVHVATKHKPVILSTGMSTLDEVAAAVNAIETTGNREIALLHCVSSYPTKAADVNLRAMDTLRETFQYPVGFSDHTLGIEIAIAAVARGASIIEKHITVDKNLPGPDHGASLEPDEFERLMRAIRDVESSFGDGRKLPTADELRTKEVVQKRVLARRVMPAGHIISESDLCLMRAPTGMTGVHWHRVVGRELRVGVQALEPILEAQLR